MIVKRHKRFLKKYSKLNLKLQIKTDEVLLKFIENPFEKSLNNHSLTGDFAGFSSINLNGDYRIIFRKIGDTYELVELLDIGTHSELYG